MGKLDGNLRRKGSFWTNNFLNSLSKRRMKYSNAKQYKTDTNLN